MILLVSGEGPSDIGAGLTAADICEGDAFCPGPMAAIIDQIIEPIWGYSPLDSAAVVFVSETALSSRSRKVSTLPKQIVLPGRKGAKDTGYFFKNARALAAMAKERQKSDPCVGAVLFRDADGTKTTAQHLWQDKVDSIERGFLAEEFDLGVAMVPRPKSEAWLLCSVQTQPYQNCERFEDLPGNDCSPNSAKAKLEQAMTYQGKSVADLVDLVRDGTINSNRISMPSFQHFHARMTSVAEKMMKA